MKKEEFLAMNLPFGLKGIDAMGDIAELIIFDKNGYFGTDLDIEEDAEELSNLDGNFLPILRPLSDLTKPIEHNGETFVPIESLKDVFMLEWCDLFDDSIDAILEFAKYNNFKKIEYLPFCIVQKLVEWKFDIAGLIEKGEAIDVNTLIENPYK